MKDIAHEDRVSVLQEFILRCFCHSLAVITYHNHHQRLCVWTDCLVQIDSLNLCNLIRQSLSISPFHTCGKWGPERLSNLPKFFKLMNQTQDSWLWDSPHPPSPPWGLMHLGESRWGAGSPSPLTHNEFHLIVSWWWHQIFHITPRGYEF